MMAAAYREPFPLHERWQGAQIMMLAVIQVCHTFFPFMGVFRQGNKAHCSSFLITHIFALALIPPFFWTARFIQKDDDRKYLPY